MPGVGVYGGNIRILTNEYYFFSQVDINRDQIFHYSFYYNTNFTLFILSYCLLSVRDPRPIQHDADPTS